MPVLAVVESYAQQKHSQYMLLYHFSYKFSPTDINRNGTVFICGWEI